VTVGNNGVFRGRSGADPCTGLGTPIAANLEERIKPATIHASTIRELSAENAQLRALIARVGMRVSTARRIASPLEASPFDAQLLASHDTPYWVGPCENGIRKEVYLDDHLEPTIVKHVSC
jgi:hypothetical protein